MFEHGFNSVRFRLTLWYVGVLGLVLIGFSIGVYTLLTRSTYGNVDPRAAAESGARRAVLRPAPPAASRFRGLAA